MTNLTNLETAVLIAAAQESFNYADASSEKQDNATIFGASEVAERLGKPVASVRGAMSSLHKKGMFTDIEAPNSTKKLSTFTDEGIDAYYAAVTAEEPAEVTEEQDEAQAESAEVQFVNDLKLAAEQEQLAIDMGNPAPGIICSTIRSHASVWEGSRKEFIEAGRAVGFNKHTLATQWQRARGK